MDQKERERRMEFARQEAGRAWCGEKTNNTEMDANLAEEFAKVLVGHMYEPHLGCATTAELIEEIRTRIEVDGKLEYKTIGND